MKEIWKPVPIEGLKELYEVSNFSNIRPRKQRPGNTRKVLKNLKPKIMPDGYHNFRYSLNGKQRYMAWHRVVALAFIPNPENKKEVNHKDLDKSNNKIENLEWVTPKENIRHAWENGAFEEATKNRTLFGGIKRGVNNQEFYDFAKSCGYNLEPCMSNPNHPQNQLYKNLHGRYRRRLYGRKK